MSVPILMYHTLDTGMSPVSIPPEVFAAQMRQLADQGCRVIRLGEVIQCLRRRDRLPHRSVVLTFDDGFESVYRTAFPILSRHNFPATVFIVPAHCGRTSRWQDEAPGIPSYPLMSWAQICELDREGIEFGAHSLSHPRLDRLTQHESAQQILQSKADIEDRLGHSVEHFAYPYGRCSVSVKTIVQQAFSGACATRLGVVCPDSDPWEVPRIDARYLAWAPLFRQMTTRTFRLYLGARRGWRALASLLLRHRCA